MSLFKNRNNMEDRLKKQLSGLEFKPSDSLWDKINEGLHDDFEKSVTTKVEEFHLKPSDEVWDKIAASVPEPRSNRSRFGLLALLIALVGLTVSATFFLMKISPSNPPKALSQQNNSSLSPTSVSDGLLPSITNKISTPSDAASEVVPTNKTNQSKQSNRTIEFEPELSNAFALEKNIVSKPAKTSVNHTTRNSKPNVITITPPDINDMKNPVMNYPIATIERSSDKLVAENQITNHDVIGDTVVKNESVVESKSATTKPAMSDSIVSAVTNVADVSQKGSDIEPPTRFTLIADVGMNYCFNRLQAPTSSNRNLDANLALRQSLEIPSIDWSGAFRLSYDINEKWRITAGISMLNFNQEFSYNTTTPMLASNGSDRNAVYINPGDSIINGPGNSTRIKYSWTEIPITLAYKFTHGQKWNVEAETGISYAILSTADAGMINYDNVGVLLIRDKTAFPGLVNSWFFTFSPAITYQLNPSIALAVHPSFKASLNSMIDDNSWLKQYPIMAGLSFSIRKRL